MIAETEMRLIKKTASRQNAADKYYEEHNYKSKTDEKIFEIDYKLWIKEKQS